LKNKTQGTEFPKLKEKNARAHTHNVTTTTTIYKYVSIKKIGVKEIEKCGDAKM